MNTYTLTLTNFDLVVFIKNLEDDVVALQACAELEHATPAEILKYQHEISVLENVLDQLRKDQ